MPTYNFKKQTKLHVVYSGLRYTLDLYPDISFSQTYNETNVPVKTLHSQYNMFENAVITKANPANFAFTVPVLLQADLDIVIRLLLDYDPSGATLKSADLYVETGTEIYKLEKAVFESGVFQIVKDAFLSLSITGTARKLSKFVDIIPGALQTRSTARSYSQVGAMLVTLAGVAQNYITSVSVEVKNDVQWLEFSTLQNSLQISDASQNIMFCEDFVVGSRTLSGTVQQYVTNETNNVSRAKIGDSLNIQVGPLGQPWSLEFLVPSTVFTNRIETQDLYIQSYDWRMISNPASLADVIKKRTI